MSVSNSHVVGNFFTLGLQPYNSKIEKDIAIKNLALFGASLAITIIAVGVIVALGIAVVLGTTVGATVFATLGVGAAFGVVGMIKGLIEKARSNSRITTKPPKPPTPEQVPVAQAVPVAVEVEPVTQNLSQSFRPGARGHSPSQYSTTQSSTSAKMTDTPTQTTMSRTSKPQKIARSQTYLEKRIKEITDKYHKFITMQETMANRKREQEAKILQTEIDNFKFHNCFKLDDSQKERLDNMSTRVSNIKRDTWFNSPF